FSGVTEANFRAVSDQARCKPWLLGKLGSSFPPITSKEFSTMTAKHAALLTVLMISAIVFMAVGIFTVDAGNSMTSTDGYGISSAR
ncbi:hypothetical protein AB664_21700, partial [Brucella anthropi]